MKNLRYIIIVFTVCMLLQTQTFYSQNDQAYLDSIQIAY